MKTMENSLDGGLRPDDVLYNGSSHSKRSIAEGRSHCLSGSQVDSEGAVFDTETAEINADIVENASDSETNDAENECLLQCNPLGISE